MTKECFFPWFVTGSVILLEDELLQPDQVAFEWGAGKSTIWLAKRVKSVVSVEHDKEWFDKVNQWIEEEELDNVTLFQTPLDSTIYEDQIRKYGEFNCAYFDVIMIDGRKRVDCIKAAIPKLKPGGILVIDNSERIEYQVGIELLKDWKKREWDSGYSIGWSTTIYWKPENE